MDTYLSYALPICMTLFPVWWGIILFIMKRTDGDCYPTPFLGLVALSFLFALGASLILPAVPFVAAAVLVFGLPAWGVYKGLDLLFNKYEIRIGKKESE